MFFMYDLTQAYEKYKGDIIFQRSFIADPITKKQVFNIGQLPRYYCTGTHPVIVDRLIWDCVELELKRQKISKHTPAGLAV